MVEALTLIKSISYNSTIFHFLEIKILGLFHRGISIIYMKIEGNLNEKESAINLSLALQDKTSN